METQKYSRRPFDVDAVKVTRENMDEVAAWCKGEIVETPATKTAKAERFIQVNVSAPANERQSRAFPNDYVLLLEGGESFKVYTTKAFNKNFVLASEAGTSASAPANTKKAERKNQKRAPKQKQPERAPENGISQEAREALRKMGEGMKKGAEKVQEAVTPSEPAKTTKGVETNFYVDPVTEEVKERKPAPEGKDETPAAPVEAPTPAPTDSPDLQVIERPVENTTEPKLEVVDEAPEVKPDGTKRKFIQKD